MAIIAMLFFAVPKTAMAGWLMDALSVQDILIQFVSAVVDIVGYALITFAGAIVNFSFGLQSFVEVPIVQIGWTIVRDMVNMVFILIMLAVAFSTILQFQTYGWKKIIPKLVIIALTINFSLIICGVITDFGNSLSSYFISAGSPNGTSEVGTNIMKAARAGALSQLRNDVNSSFTAELAALVMQLIFYIILAFILFAIGILMIYRLLMLWILIIISPAAWISTIISPGSFKNWWKKFINLAVVLPVAMSFFVFFSIVLGSTFQGSPGMIFDIGSSQGVMQKIFPNMTFSVIMQFLVVMSFLGFGLTFATKTGVAGGAMVVNWAKKGKDWGMGKMKAAPAGAGRTGLRAADKVAGWAGRPGEATRQWAKGRELLEKVPFTRSIVGGPGTRFAEQQKELKASAGKFAGLRPQDIEARLKEVAVTPQALADRAGMIKTLIDKGQFSLDDPSKKLDWLKMIQTFQNNGGSIVDLLKKRPDLMENADVQRMITKDVNAPQPVKDKWQKVINEPNTDNKVGLLKTIHDEDIIKSATDFAGIQKEALDRKGKLSDANKTLYEGYEKDKETAERQRGTDEANYRKQNERLQQELAEAKRGGNATDIARAMASIEDAERTEATSIGAYMQEIQRLEREQINISKRTGPDMILKFINEGLKKGGNLYAGNLSGLLSRDKATHGILMKYLKMQAPFMEGMWKGGVSEHVTAGIVGQTMFDSAAGAPGGGGGGAPGGGGGGGTPGGGGGGAPGGGPI